MDVKTTFRNLVRDQSVSICMLQTLIAKLYLKYIWDCRNRYVIPDLELAKENICQKMKTIIGISNIMREHLNDSGLVAIFSL
jgi:hypothetical protein